MITHHNSAAGQVVVPGDTEVMAIDASTGLEADPLHESAVLVSHPEGCLPHPEVGHVEGHGAGMTPDG